MWKFLTEKIHYLIKRVLLKGKTKRKIILWIIQLYWVRIFSPVSEFFFLLLILIQCHMQSLKKLRKWIWSSDLIIIRDPISSRSLLIGILKTIWLNLGLKNSANVWLVGLDLSFYFIPSYHLSFLLNLKIQHQSCLILILLT